MRAYKCDRCERLYSDKPVGATLTVRKNGVREGDSYLDLCPRCQSELENWIKRKPLRVKNKPQQIAMNPEFNGGFQFGEVS